MELNGPLMDAIKKARGEYTCGSFRYMISVVVPAFLILGLLIFFAFKVAGGHPTRLEQTGVLVLPIVLFFSVLSANQPFAFIIDSEKLKIKSYWKKTDYAWKDLSSLKIKEFGFVDRVYIRVGAGRLLSGRYWLDVNVVNNGRALMDFLKIIEGTLHPDRVQYQMTSGNARRTRRS